MAHRRIAVTKLVLGRVGGRTVVNPGESVDLTDDELRDFERMNPPVIRMPPDAVRHVAAAASDGDGDKPQPAISVHERAEPSPRATRGGRAASAKDGDDDDI